MAARKRWSVDADATTRATLAELRRRLPTMDVLEAIALFRALTGASTAVKALVAGETDDDDDKGVRRGS